jgi:hypothetical protein
VGKCKRVKEHISSENANPPYPRRSFASPHIWFTFIHKGLFFRSVFNLDATSPRAVHIVLAVLAHITFAREGRTQAGQLRAIRFAETSRSIIDHALTSGSKDPTLAQAALLIRVPAAYPPLAVPHHRRHHLRQHDRSSVLADPDGWQQRPRLSRASRSVSQSDHHPRRGKGAGRHCTAPPRMGGHARVARRVEPRRSEERGNEEDGMDRHGHVGVVEVMLLDAREARSETPRNKARTSEYRVEPVTALSPSPAQA